MYPEMVLAAGKERELLINLAGSYLYKDILSFRGIRKPELLNKLLRALALQLGSEVSYYELSRLLEIDKQTVENYISLLEKAFIITRLQPLSRNLRKEISSSRKIYFLDNGIRNALINNFNPLNLRQDVGALWENFMISERIKANHYHQNHVNVFFWRTHDKQEIDLVEESGGKYEIFEFKWKVKPKWKVPPGFASNYPIHKSNLIHQDNFEEDFLF